MTDNQNSKIKVGVQTPPTDRPLTAGDARMMEQIAHNLCSLHDFDVAIVAGLERFAKAVITEYERARPATSAASEGEVAYARLSNCPDYIDDADGLERIRSSLLEVKDWHDLPGAIVNCNSLARLLDTIEMQRAKIAALASPPVSERERELEGALREASDAIDSFASDFITAHDASPNGSLIRLSAFREAVAALCAAGLKARAPTAQPAGEGK